MLITYGLPVAQQATARGVSLPAVASHAARVTALVTARLRGQGSRSPTADRRGTRERSDVARRTSEVARFRARAPRRVTAVTRRSGAPVFEGETNGARTTFDFQRRGRVYAILSCP